MEIGDPFGFLSKQKAHNTNFRNKSQKPNHEPIDRKTIYNELKHVVTDIIRKEVKNKKKNKQQHERTNHYEDQNQLLHKQLNTAIIDQQSIELESAVNHESHSVLDDTKDENTPDDLDNVKNNTAQDDDNDSNADNVISENDNEISDNSEKYEESTNNDGNVMIEKEIVIPAVIEYNASHENVNKHSDKAKYVLSKVDRKISTSLRSGIKPTGRNYKILQKCRRILNLLKPALMSITVSYGSYYMLRSCSHFLSLVSTNPTPFISSVLFSVISAIAGNVK